MRAARLAEFSEAQAYVSLAAGASSVDGLTVESTSLGGGLAIRCGHDRSTTLLNRIFGLGLNEDIDRSTMDLVTAYFSATQGPWSLELTPAAASETALALLKKARMRRGLPSAVLAIDCCEAAARLSPYRIERVGSELGAVGAAIEAQVFRVSDTLRSLLSQAPKHLRFRQWVAFDGDIPVGACLTHLLGEVSWFGWSATLPAYRGRGIQSALLARCVGSAAEEGCRWMTAETGIGTTALPDPSYRNMLRFGFTELYRRHSYLFVSRERPISRSTSVD